MCSSSWCGVTEGDVVRWLILFSSDTLIFLVVEAINATALETKSVVALIYSPSHALQLRFIELSIVYFRHLVRDDRVVTHSTFISGREIFVLLGLGVEAVKGCAAMHFTETQVNESRVPKHVAVIMDGNGRWATKRGKSRVFGHQSGVHAVRELVEGCRELKIPYLTLYAFSTENWRRSGEEVAGILDLIKTTIDRELAKLIQNRVRLVFIGDLKRLPISCQKTIHKAAQASQHNQDLQLTIALSYGGEWDLVEAVRSVVRDVQKGILKPESIDAELFKKYLSMGGVPDPELMIRTSGEMRLSGFLLGQIAYTELFFSPVLWPEFRKQHFLEAIVGYQKRKRRFGGSGGTISLA